MGIMTDGFPTTLTFATAYSGLALYFKETEITPPGVDVGEMNDVTTMRNTAWRTFAFRKLKTLLESGLVCEYDPAILDEIVLAVGKNQQLVLTLPNNSTWTFWGGIKTFQPQAHVEGQPPKANIAIGVTNHNGTDGALGEEIAPVYAAAP